MREIMLNTKGFTLIETTIAIMIMMIGVIGVYAIIPRLVKTAAISSDRFIAAQLAKEGVELARNLRDSVFLSNAAADWQTVLLVELAPCFGVVASGPAESNQGCEFDYNDTISALAPAPAYAGRYLKINNNGFYDYNGAAITTKFKRRIIVNTAKPLGVGLAGPQVGANDMLEVTVEVTWSDMTKPLRVHEQLYNWRY